MFACGGMFGLIVRGLLDVSSVGFMRFLGL